jgi:hypothetical protein
VYTCVALVLPHSSVHRIIAFTLERLEDGNGSTYGRDALHPNDWARGLCGQVADFGISRVKDPMKSYLSATNNNGTPMYMAPEQFNGTHLDEKVAFVATWLHRLHGAS